MQDAPQIALKPGRRVARERIRLLIVDQDESMRSILAQLLGRAGYAVKTAGSAEEVLEAGWGDWDCLVTELELPGLGGLELYARLIFQRRVRLPAVFLSTRVPLILELGLREAHWVRLLRKPSAFTALLEAVEQCLGAPRTL